MALRHIVLLKFAPGVEKVKLVSEIDTKLAALPGLIPEIKSYKFGADLGLADNNHDYAIVGEFADTASYKVYAEHPDHVAVITSTIKPNLAPGGRSAVQMNLE